MVIGLLLTGLGVVVVVRGEMSGPGLRMHLPAPRTTFWSQVGSTGPPSPLRRSAAPSACFSPWFPRRWWRRTRWGRSCPFIIYGVGMGASVLTVTLLAVLVGSGVTTALRKRTTMIMRVGGVLMILAGLYVVVFGLAEILPRFGIEALNPVLYTTARWQSAVTEAIQSWGTPVLVALVVAVMAAVVWIRRSGEPAVPPASEDVDAFEDGVTCQPRKL